MLRATCRALEANLKEISLLDEDTILIPNNTLFVAITLPKYFGQLNGANWSLWMRDKTPRAQPYPPAAQNTVQEQPETASVAAIMNPSPSVQPPLEAGKDAFENWVRTELAAIWSRLPSEKEPLAAAKSGPSQSVPDSRRMVAHHSYQMNQADGYGSVPSGSLPKPHIDARGFEALLFDSETAPPYDPFGALTSAAGQPAFSPSPDYGFGANPGIPQAQADPDGQAALEWSFPQAYPQENGSADILQAAGTSSAHQQIPTAEGSFPTWPVDFEFGSAPSPSQAPTRTKPSNHRADSVFVVASPVLPHSPGPDVGANPDNHRAQTDPDGQTAPGPSQQARLQEHDSADMSQAAGTSSGHQHSPITEASLFNWLDSYFGSVSGAQAPTSTKVPNRLGTPVSFVANKAKPKTRNHGLQAQNQPD
ncbi:hypothetical protein FRC00_001725 [Tulasnella sp. 408]|nr:hypothetical protein FRC00_001725 [Tulasnella sp. 408]